MFVSAIISVSRHCSRPGPDSRMAITTSSQLVCGMPFSMKICWVVSGSETTRRATVASRESWTLRPITSMAEARSNFTKAASAPARLGSMTENCRTGAPWSMSVSASMMGKMRRAPWVSAFEFVFNAQSTGGAGKSMKRLLLHGQGPLSPKVRAEEGSCFTSFIEVF